MKAFWNTIGVIVGIPVGLFLAFVLVALLMELGS